MVSSLYVAASGMISEEKRLDVISNNLSNVDTPGFKKDRVTFSDYFYHTGIVPGSPKRLYKTNRWIGFDSQNSSVFADRSYVDFSDGVLRETDKPTSAAIVGRGFFVVRKDGKELFTRAGNFVVGADGVLRTPDGAEVLGRVSPNLPPEPVVVDPKRDVIISEDGAVVQDGNPLFYLEIRDFKGDYNRYLKKFGYGYFESKDVRNTGFFLKDVNLMVGYLEISNADVVREMVNLISCIRHYEACQKAVQITFEDTVSRSVNDVGRIA